MQTLRLGIDIGGSSVKAVALDGDRPLWQGQSKPYSRPNAEQLSAAIVESANNRIAKDSSIIVGLCVPGILDLPNRRVTLAVNVPGLTEAPLDQLLQNALGPYANLKWIGSDAVAATADVAHAKHLAGRVFALAIGTGVGGAILDDGRPLLVSGNSPGHWGQVDVSLAGEDVIAPDGGAGGLEGYISTAAMQKRYGSEDIPAICAKLTGNDVPIRALVRAIRIAHAIYRPQHVVLVGGIGIQLNQLTEEIHRQVSTNLTSVARPEWTLTAGNDAWHAARGAAMLAG
ncbi:MAG TPA: ROK family protein [Tepidisphaeraceae bacterium]|nr:ROK family protein [Tepidisphaeraceae bacterium]